MTDRISMARRAAAGLRAGAAREPLAGLAAAAAAGILAADRWLWWPGAWMLLAAGALLAWWLRPGWNWCLAAGAAAVFAAAHGASRWNAELFPFSPNLKNGESIRMEAEGLVVKEPAAPGAGRSRGGRCVIRFTEMQVAGMTWRCDQRLPVRLGGSSAAPRYGDKVRVTGLLKPFDPPRAPGAFDPALFFRRSLGAGGEFILGPGDKMEILERGQGSRLIALSLRSRTAVERFITRGLEEDPESAAVIKAMVLGSREDTPEHVEEQFRLSGAMHVFAVSGLHVGIFGAILWWLMRLAGVPRRWAVLLLAPAILFYAAVTGLRPSATRAALMGSVLLLGHAADRRARLFNSLGFAALLILAWDTRQLHQPGFQLSFAVLASLAWFADRWSAAFYRPWRVDPFLPWGRVPRWRRGLDRGGRWLSGALAVSLAAWIGSAPLIAWHFQLATPVAVAANVVMVPAAFLVLGAACASLLVSLAGGGWLAAAAINPLNARLAGAVTAMAGAFAAIPGGHFPVSPGELRDSLPRGGARITVYEPTPSGLAQLWSFRPADGPTAHWMVDPGDPAGFAAVGQPLLRHRAVGALQALVLTHGDHAHVGAAPLVIERARPAAVIESIHESRAAARGAIEDSMRRAGVPRLRLARGDRLSAGESGDGAEITVLYPSRDEPAPSLADDRCLVFQLRHQGWRVLHTADSGFFTEKWLLAREERGLPADVWIKGWHASDLSGLAEFLDQVQPAAVVTTHREFPERERASPAWREELASRGIALFVVSEIGAVEISLDAERLRVAPAASPAGKGQAPLILTRP